MRDIPGIKSHILQNRNPPNTRQETPANFCSATEEPETFPVGSVPVPPGSSSLAALLCEGCRIPATNGLKGVTDTVLEPEVAKLAVSVELRSTDMLRLREALS